MGEFKSGLNMSGVGRVLTGRSQNEGRGAVSRKGPDKESPQQGTMYVTRMHIISLIFTTMVCDIAAIILKMKKQKLMPVILFLLFSEQKREDKYFGW